jgi:hypothetical protein
LDSWKDIRKELLTAVATAFARLDSDEPANLVIKFSSPSLLGLELIRSVWPTVPCLVVVRDPIEVVVSHLQDPGGWLRMKSDPLAASERFGFDGLNIRDMSSVEYSGRVVSRLCQSALTNWHGACRVLDYAAIDEAMMGKIATFFGLPWPGPDREELARVMRTYSKDAGRSREFRRDEKRKQLLASESLRQDVECWTQTPYQELKSLQGL